jgi:hypothetical protein
MSSIKHVHCNKKGKVYLVFKAEEDCLLVKWIEVTRTILKEAGVGVGARPSLIWQRREGGGLDRLAPRGS